MGCQRDCFVRPVPVQMSRVPFAIPLVACIVAATLAMPGSLRAQACGNTNATVALTLLVDNPTIHHLSFRWPISGDENMNATVRVSYRRKDVIHGARR